MQRTSLRYSPRKAKIRHGNETKAGAAWPCGPQTRGGQHTTRDQSAADMPIDGTKRQKKGTTNPATRPRCHQRHQPAEHFLPPPQQTTKPVHNVRCLPALLGRINKKHIIARNIADISTELPPLKLQSFLSSPTLDNQQHATNDEISRRDAPRRHRRELEV